MQLAANVFYANNVLFFASMSNQLHYGTSNAVDNIQAITLESGLKNIIRYYAIRGFSLRIIFIDIQFKALKDYNALGIATSMVSRGEHVKEIERSHHVIKERCRCYYAMQPHNSLLRMIVVHLIIIVVFYVNAFV